MSLAGQPAVPYRAIPCLPGHLEQWQVGCCWVFPPMGMLWRWDTSLVPSWYHSLLSPAGACFPFSCVLQLLMFFFSKVSSAAVPLCLKQDQAADYLTLWSAPPPCGS